MATASSFVVRAGDRLREALDALDVAISLAESAGARQRSVAVLRRIAGRLRREPEEAPARSNGEQLRRAP
jgi:hypothetical protein